MEIGQREKRLRDRVEEVARKAKARKARKVVDKKRPSFSVQPIEEGLWGVIRNQRRVVAGPFAALADAWREANSLIAAEAMRVYRQGRRRPKSRPLTSAAPMPQEGA